MTRIQIERTPAYIEYETSGVERKVEEGLKELGLSWKETYLSGGAELILTDDEITSFRLGTTRIEGTFDLTRKTDTNGKGVQIEYTRFAPVLLSSLPLQQALRILRDDNRTIHYITFENGSSGDIGIYTYKMARGTVVSDEPHFEQAKKYVHQKFGQHSRIIENGVLYAAPITDVYWAIVQFLKKK